MKHLKGYKLFESDITLKEDIEDILIDFNDNDLSLEVITKDDIAYIEISNRDKPFDLSIYIDNFEKLNNYLENEGYVVYSFWLIKDTLLNGVLLSDVSYQDKFPKGLLYELKQLDMIKQMSIKYTIISF